MQLFFIRHGNPDYITDSLTKKGIEQAEALARNIESLGISRIYQSPMGRAKETAFYSAKKLGIEPITLDWIRELEWGDKSGDAYSSDSPWVKNENIIQEELSYPQGDSWKKHPKIIEDRIVFDIESREKALDSFLQGEGYFRQGQLYRSERENQDSIAFFCHAGLSSALVAYLLNISFWQMIAQFSFAFTSVTKIILPEKILSPAHLDYMNDYSHLKGIE